MDIKAELLLTKAETDAIIVENASVYSGDCMDAVLKAQATKAVTGVFERLDALLLAGHILENYDEDYGKETEKQYKGIKQELLDKIKEGK